MKQLLSLCLTILLLGCLCTASGEDGFAASLESRYLSPDIAYRTEARWWMAEGAHTDETLLEEIQAAYDAGYRGLELCQLNLFRLDASVYGYGTAQWDHDFHLVLNRCLDLGMTVGITSGTNWSTANYPGLDPDSMAASQCVVYTTAKLSAGERFDGPLPASVQAIDASGKTRKTTLRDKAVFIGAYAYKKAASGNETRAKEVDPDGIIDLTDLVILDEARHTGSLTWTAPEDGDYYLMFYFMQGTAQKSEPAAEASYCINYFDRAGLLGLEAYWEAHILNDAALNEKIAAGDVQVFMDSLEYSTGDGFLMWSVDFADEFIRRKGYDFRPYLILGIGLPEPKGIDAHPEAYGKYNLTDAVLAREILNDYHDVLTELYMENLLRPFAEWLHTYGIRLRAQISYGKYLEISEPEMAVDYPETENLNQVNQVDMYRLWTGGAHLQNKILSAETSALPGYSYVYDFQTWAREAYVLYSAGISRINWHIWTSQWAPESISVDWPGFRSQNSFQVLGLREPGYDDFAAFNDHLGRIQQLLREGVSRTDVGIPHIAYGQLILAPTAAGKQVHQNWLLRHESIPGYFPSYCLQDNGYTYDYFSPEFLFSDEVFFNPETGTIEQAGYKAVVLYESWLTAEGAEKLLSWANQGLKIVIVGDAASQTPYNDGKEEQLSACLAEMRSLDTVASVASADETADALRRLGVVPYAGFSEPNGQLLTQVRQDGDVRYLYVYNYCPDLYCGEDHTAGSGHGTAAAVQMVVEGLYIPYVIDSWSGKVTELAAYRHQEGKTAFPVTLSYGDVALYALCPAEEVPVHAMETNAYRAVRTEEGLVLRSVESGSLTASLSDGRSISERIELPEISEITGWTLTVESWTPGEEVFRRETVNGVETVEHTIATEKTPVTVDLEHLVPWNRIHGIGRSVSGKGYYRAEFQWDAGASGAYLDFGTLVQSMKLKVNGVELAVNWNRPVVDIGPVLMDGTNTIEIEYSSNLTNIQLERGDLKESSDVGNWAGYDVSYRGYGLVQAILIPYLDTIILE
ncbi:MAG: hypothetical protein IKH77_03980 [Clostridia bacterium]|nr:hypothetical protein [Clostridia bacterium]